jgi:hypothetical protein
VSRYTELAGSDDGGEFGGDDECASPSDDARRGAASGATSGATSGGASGAASGAACGGTGSCQASGAADDAASDTEAGSVEEGQLDADDATVAGTGVVTTAVGHDVSEPFNQQPIDDLLATASADATDVMLGEPPTADVDAEGRNDRAADARVVEFERQPAGHMTCSVMATRAFLRAHGVDGVDEGVTVASMMEYVMSESPRLWSATSGPTTLRRRHPGGVPPEVREQSIRKFTSNMVNVGDHERPAFSQSVVVHFLLDRFGAKLKMLRVSRSSLVRTLGSERHALLVGRHGSVQHIVAVTRGEGREGNWVLHDCDSEGPVVLGGDESDGTRWHRLQLMTDMVFVWPK